MSESRRTECFGQAERVLVLKNGFSPISGPISLLCETTSRREERMDDDDDLSAGGASNALTCATHNLSLSTE